MIYQNIKRAVFIDRPNRFIAYVLLDGKREVCHVKNTGRCRELLIPGVNVMVQDSSKPKRKTKYDLISVWKGTRLINMDAAAPNKVFGEWIAGGGLFTDVKSIKPEQRFGSSRFDFYVETENRKVFVEVKGVTLEENGIVRFPDAPTERGVKHLHELEDCIRAGYDAYIVFIIQMKDVMYFEPNRAAQPAFGDALKSAVQAGVNVLAIDCEVTEDSIKISDYVDARV